MNNSTLKAVADLTFAAPKKIKPKPVILKAHRRSAQQVIAGIAAGFLPVASYVIAHIEAQQANAVLIPYTNQPALYLLVLAALAYSAPTLATWAKRWAGSAWKAWSFTVLLEGVMVFSHIQPLSLTGLVLLVSINAVTAYGKAVK